MSFFLNHKIIENHRGFAVNNNWMLPGTVFPVKMLTTNSPSPEVWLWSQAHSLQNEGAEQGKIPGHSVTWCWGQPKSHSPPSQGFLVQTRPNQLFPTYPAYLLPIIRRGGVREKDKKREMRKWTSPFIYCPEEHASHEHIAPLPIPAWGGLPLEDLPEPLPLSPFSLSQCRSPWLVGGNQQLIFLDRLRLTL